MFSVDDLFQNGNTIAVTGSDGRGLKVYDRPKNSRIVERFEENGVKYVVVKFDNPGNPPSNNYEYLYLAP